MVETVLIVDDSEFMRSLLKQILTDSLEVVAEAENGAQAVELYKEHDPDLVMMDVVMPKLDGIEATSALTDYDPDATVVMCTSVGQDEKMKYAAKAGAEGYVTKPFQNDSVVQAIEDAFDEQVFN